MDSPTSSATAVADVPAPKPAAPATPIRRGPRARFLLLASLATAGLLWLSYFPVNCGWLAWFALVPLLVLVRATRPTPARLPLRLARRTRVLPAGPAMDARRRPPHVLHLDRRGRLLFSVFPARHPCCPLYRPSHALAAGPDAARRVDRPGVLPLLVRDRVLVVPRRPHAARFSADYSDRRPRRRLRRQLPRRRRQRRAVRGAVPMGVVPDAVRRAGRAAPRRLSATAIEAGAVAAALAAAIGYGEWRLGQDAFTPGPTVALVQGSVPQQIRNNMVQLMASHYFALCDLAAQQNPKPALIVWPETSYPGAWYDTASDAPKPAPDGWDDDVRKCRSQLADVVHPWKTDVLLGLDSGVFEADGHTHVYNSALLLDREARPLGRYDKIHCVPFGEYVPFREWLPWMRVFAPYDFDYSVTPGRTATRFPLNRGPDHRFSFGVAICYEDTDSDRTRPYAGGDGGPAVDFLLNIVQRRLVRRHERTRRASGHLPLPGGRVPPQRRPRRQHGRLRPDRPRRPRPGAAAGRGHGMGPGRRPHHDHDAPRRASRRRRPPGQPRPVPHRSQGRRLPRSAPARRCRRGGGRNTKRRRAFFWPTCRSITVAASTPGGATGWRGAAGFCSARALYWGSRRTGRAGSRERPEFSCRNDLRALTRPGSPRRWSTSLC